MTYLIFKILLSAVIVTAVSEIAKKSSLWAAGLASLPLVSVLAIVWIYLETKDVDQIKKLSTDIFWLVIPSLIFFVLFPQLLQRGLHFWPSIVISSIATMGGYMVTLKFLGTWG